MAADRLRVARLPDGVDALIPEGGAGFLRDLPFPV